MDVLDRGNKGIPIGELAIKARTWSVATLSAQLGSRFLVGVPEGDGSDDDDDDEWVYQTSYVRSVPEANGRLVFIDVKRSAVFPLRKARKGPFADTILVGRSASNDVCVDHASVSKLHARIRRVGDDIWRISDAGSLNGTKVNGQGLSGDAEVRDGDCIAFGSVVLEVYSAQRLHHILMRLT